MSILNILLNIGLRRRHIPKTPEDYFALGTIVILYMFYASRKGKWFNGILKWIISIILAIVGCIGVLYFERRWYMYFCWTLTSPLIYVILYVLFRKFMLRKKKEEAYLYENNPEELNSLSDQEDMDMHKIIVVGVVLWFLAGLFIS